MKMQVLLDSSGAVLGMSQPLSMQTESGTVAVSLVAGRGQRVTEVDVSEELIYRQDVEQLHAHIADAVK